MKRTLTCLLLIVGWIASPVSAEVEGKITAGAWNGAGYFYSETDAIGTGDIRLHNTVRITGIAYDWQGLTLRAGEGQRIQDGFPTPLRLVLTQKSAPTRDRQFGRRIAFSHSNIRYTGRFAYIHHTHLSQEQSKDLQLIGEDIKAGDVFWLYVYAQQVARPRPDTPQQEQPQSEQPRPDGSQTLYDMKFTLGWNPVAHHTYLWENRVYGDTASPEALGADNGTEVQINRIACDTPEMRFISYEGDLRQVLPRTYALKIRKVWHTTSGWRHLRVLTTDARVRVERLGDGSVLLVPKSIGSWTPEPQSPQRVSYYQTIGSICANTVGTNGAAYIHLVVTETGAPRAPQSPYLRKLTGLWGELKKQ